MLNVTPFTTLLSGEMLAIYINPEKLSAEQAAQQAWAAADKLAVQGWSADALQGADYVAAADEELQKRAKTVADNLGLAAESVAQDADGQKLSAMQQQRAAASIAAGAGSTQQPLTQAQVNAQLPSAILNAAAVATGDILSLLQKGAQYDTKVDWDAQPPSTDPAPLNGYIVTEPVSGQANIFAEKPYTYKVELGKYVLEEQTESTLHYANGAWSNPVPRKDVSFRLSGTPDAGGFVDATELPTQRWHMKVAVQTVDLSGKPMAGTVRTHHWAMAPEAQKAKYPPSSTGYYFLQQRSATDKEYEIHWDGHLERFSVNDGSGNKLIGVQMDEPSYLRDWSKCWTVTNPSTPSANATYSSNTPGCLYSDFDSAINGAWYLGGGLVAKKSKSGGNQVDIMWESTMLATVPYKDVVQGNLQMRYLELADTYNELRSKMDLDSRYEQPALFMYKGHVAKGTYFALPAGAVLTERNAYPSLNKTAINAVLKAWGLPEL